MSDVSPRAFDWSLIASLADESFGIPPDVTFQIDDGDQVYEIKAHKTILGMVSLPFKTMLYTTEVGDKTAKVIRIGETTGPAFQILIDAIYQTKSLFDSLKGKSVEEIFDVVYLIEQYQISQLQEFQDAVKELLSDYPVTEDSVLDVAGEAMEYSTLFQKEAHYLLLKCAKFLQPKLKDAQSIFNYAAKINDKKEVFTSLLGLMKDLPPIKCSNCGYEDCKDGLPIQDNEFREGLNVTNNIDDDEGGYWEGQDKGPGTIMKVVVEGNYVEVCGPRYMDDMDDDEYGCYDKQNYDGNPTFNFFCKELPLV